MIQTCLISFALATVVLAVVGLGLAGLWFGTEVTIRGAVSAAKRFGVSEFIVGVVILSIGSDLPELAIAIDAGMKNLAGGDYSNVVVGSAQSRSPAKRPALRTKIVVRKPDASCSRRSAYRVSSP